MKLNIKGLVFVGFAAAVFASAANAAGEEKTVTSLKYTEATYQKKLTAGDNIDITNDTISATDTTYSAGTGIAISEQNVISVEGNLTDYAAGTNVQFTAGTGDNAGKTVISATDTTYGAFNGSANGLVPASGAAAGKVLSGDGSWVTVDGTPYTQGSHITINNHQISAEDDGAVASGDTKLVTGGTVYTAVDARVPKQIGTQADEGKVLTVNNAGQVTLSAADTYQKKLTPGNFVSIDNSGNITTTYSAGTNVNISNTGVISADDTTYAAGTHVTISGANNAINVADNGTISANDTGLVTGQTVYNYVTGLIPASLPSSCDATHPCALVLAGSTPTWEPIQQ